MQDVPYEEQCKMVELGTCFWSTICLQSTTEAKEQFNNDYKTSNDSCLVMLSNKIM